MFKVANRLYMLSQQVAGKQSQKLVNIDWYKNFAKVTLNNPKALNSVNIPMINQINAQLNKLSTQTKAFWIQGAGGKAFCAGGDVKGLYQNRETNPKLLADFFREEFTLDYKLTKLKTLQISNWDGIVMGGGVGLSVFSPYRIATQNTLFAMPECKIGFFTDVCGGYFLSRLRNNLGYYLGLTGARLKGQEVYKAGIANYFIPRADLPKVFQQLKTQLAKSKSPKQTVDEIINKYNKPPTSKSIEHQDQIRYIFNSNSVEEIYQKLKQNKTPFYSQVKQAIDQQCPLSVHVTFKSIQKSKTKEMKDCFITDYDISQRFMKGKDFFEGVRCTLVDKGAKPTWSHKNVTEVAQKQVQGFFEPLSQDKRLKL